MVAALRQVGRKHSCQGVKMIWGVPSRCQPQWLFSWGSSGCCGFPSIPDLCAFCLSACPFIRHLTAGLLWMSEGPRVLAEASVSGSFPSQAAGLWESSPVLLLPITPWPLAQFRHGLVELLRLLTGLAHLSLRRVLDSVNCDCSSPQYLVL